eukprot:7097280-Prorocentrum_lima.AAC.1
MTSSLVGSEMCIRDRIPPKPAMGLRRLPSHKASLLIDACCHAASQHWGCLLYTSDAADDM